MAERKESILNRIVDQVLYDLGRIGKDDAYQWLTQPRTVARMGGPSNVLLPRPALFVSVPKFTSNQPIPGQTHHDATLELQVALMVQDVARPDAVLHDLFADVVKALSQNWELKDGAGVSALNGGYLFWSTYEADTEVKDGGAGEAMGVVMFQGLVMMDVTEP